MSKSQHPNPPHQRQNKPDNHRTPIFNLGGLLSVYGGDRGGRAVEAAFPSGERASKPRVRFGQQGFCNFVSMPGFARRNADLQIGEIGVPANEPEGPAPIALCRCT